VAEAAAETGLLDRRAARRVHLPREDTGPRRLAACFLRVEHCSASFLVARRRLPAGDRPAEIGAVPVDDRAEIEEDDLALAQLVMPCRPARVEPPLAPREDVRRERGAARAADAQLVLDLLDE
jgi:hypothetical protein